MRHLQNLLYLRAIVEAGSIRKATEKLAISPSALQRQVQNLEQDLGIQIFERLSRGSRLSLEGEIFYDYALRQINAFERMQMHLQQLRGGTSKLSIAFAPDIILKHYLAIVAQFQNKFVHIDLKLQILEDEHIYAQLASGELDLALMLNPVLKKDLQTLHAKDIQLSAFVPQGIELSRDGSVKLHDIAAHRLALPPERSFTYKRIHAVAERSKIDIATCYQGADMLEFLSRTSLPVIGVAPCPDHMLADLASLSARQKIPTKALLPGYKQLSIDPRDIGKCTLGLISQQDRELSRVSYKFQEALSAILQD